MSGDFFFSSATMEETLSRSVVKMMTRPPALPRRSAAPSSPPPLQARPPQLCEGRIHLRSQVRALQHISLELSHPDASPRGQ